MTDWLSRWKTAVEAGDAHTAAEAVAAEAVLVSPLTDRFEFRGRGEIETLLRSVFEVFTGIGFLDDLRGDGRAVLVAEGDVGALRLWEAQHLLLDRDGRIDRMTLAMRPLPAVTAFTRALGPRVVREQGRPGMARVLAGAGAFLDTVAASGDRRFLPLASPERAGRDRLPR